MRIILCRGKDAVVTNKLLIISTVILATLAILLSPVSVAYADNLDSLTVPTDIGIAPNSVTIQLDKATKTFNITGNGTIDKNKFNALDLYDNPTSGYYHDKIMAAIDPLNRITDPLKQYTIHVAGSVHLPNNSSALFLDIETKITIDPTINTSNVTDMSSMFAHAENANPDVSKWDTSKVTDMSSMFAHAQNANPDVSKWDTSKVTDMSSMFNAAENADPNVSDWNTSKVTNMSSMFNDAHSANPDVSKWDTSKVTDMSSMFDNAENANPDVSKWDTSKVTDMSSMFNNAENANPDVSKWDTSKVTNMSWMFHNAENANPDVSKWDTSKVTSMRGMFLSASPIGLDISHFTYTNKYRDDSTTPDMLKYLNVSRFDYLAVQAGNHTDNKDKYLKILKSFKLSKHIKDLRRYEIEIESAAADLALYHITDYAAYQANHNNGKTLVATFFGSTIPDSILQNMVSGQYYEIKKNVPGYPISGVPISGVVTAPDTVVGMSVHGAMIAAVKDTYGNLVPDGTQLQVYEPGVAKPVVVTVKDGKAAIPDFTAPTTVGVNTIKVTTMDGQPVTSGTFKTIPVSPASGGGTSLVELSHTGSNGVLPLVLSVLLSMLGVGVLMLQRYTQGRCNN